MMNHSLMKESLLFSWEDNYKVSLSGKKNLYPLMNLILQSPILQIEDPFR